MVGLIGYKQKEEGNSVCSACHVYVGWENTYLETKKKDLISHYMY